MKKLTDFLSEKLIINKNFKDNSSNDNVIALSIVKKYIDLNQTRVYTKKDISRVSKFSKKVLNDIGNLFGSSLDLTDYKKLINICKQFDELDTLYRLDGYDIVNNGIADVIIKISKKIEGNGKNVWANDDGISNRGLNIFRTDDLIIIMSLKNSAGWVHIGFNQKDLDDVEPFEEKVDEKLIINKDFKEYIIKCTNDDVHNIVLDEVKKQAKRPQRESRPINLNHIDVSEVTSMSCLFDTVNEVLLDDAIHLKYIDISEWDVSNVEEMKWMFAGCKNLVSVGDLSKWKLDNIRDLQGMFENCIKLEHIGDISNWHVDDILDSGFDGMFKGCTRLKGNVGNLLKWNITPRTLLNLNHQGII